MSFSPQRTPRTQRIILTGLIFVSFVSFVFAAAPSPQEMYVEAMARERTIRAALAADEPSPTVADVREVVTDYLAIVRTYPASGYSDNALWQAGRLSIDAFLRFGQEQDKAAGVRLLRRLTTEYPTSSRVKDAPAELARVKVASPASPKVVTPPSVKVNTPAKVNLATLKAVRRELLDDAVRVTIELDGEVASFHDERILNPVRVFVDLPYTRAAPALADKTLRFDGDSDAVHQIRIGRHPNETTRVVLDAGGVSSYSVYPLYNPYRLVIDCVRESRPEPATLVEASGPPDPLAGEKRSRPAANPPPPLPSRQLASQPMSTRPLASESVSPPLLAPEPLPSKPLPAAAVSTAAPPRNIGGGYSLARQLGLSVSRIVIDPGHGGHDPGATGKSISEAELVLDIALRVEKLLQGAPGVEVILTRRTDEFVSLQERTAIANREGADLFLSIHANASQNTAAHGVETYYLNLATNMNAASVAARENAASGQTMGALPDFLRAIALNNKLDESRDLAATVQGELIERLRSSNKIVKDLGVKQAPFVVLIGAAMPSVLTEISFVTNGPEVKLLRGGAYRQRIAEALAGAITKYQQSLTRVVKVAHQ